MSNVTATILVPMNLSSGASAVNYTPSSNMCPIMAMNCVIAPTGGTSTVKLTPYSATNITVGGSGSGGRLRIACDANGAITTVEIASGGTGYSNGPVPITLTDPYGSGGSISCTASGGSLSAVSISSPGCNYSGYVTINAYDFIPSVTYDIMPRYVEFFGSDTLTLLGYRLAFRPFQQF